jgi:hypothetical protein
MTSSELKLIKKMMPGYANYMKTYPDSLLSKILGIFTVESEKFSKVHIMMMENTIRLKDAKQLRFVFDLKGSTVDRYVKGPVKPSSTLKDLNFISKKKTRKHITSLDEPTRKRLVQAMRNDVLYLRS